MKSILISGLKGFVGTNLGAYFKNMDYEVIGLSRSGQGKSSENDLAWESVGSVVDLQVKTIIHLAGKAHDLKKTSDEADYFAINTGLTIKLFDIFLKSKADTFIYFSSVKAVADSVNNFLSEEVRPNPQTAYGKSKLKAEEYLLSQNVPAGKRVIILRPCMIHGPGNKGNLNLLYQVVSKGIPYPLAAFRNMRSFLSIDNLCFIINQIIEDAAIPSGIYNVADDESLSTNEVVKIIAETLDRKARLWAIPQPLLRAIAAIGDRIKLPLNSERLTKLTESYVVSNDKIKRVLRVDHLPKSASEGLRATINSFRLA